MKKVTKMLCKIMPVVLVGLLIVSNVFGISFNESTLTGGSEAGTVTNLAKNIWSTVAVIVQILAVAAIVFAGVRYMFASANDKADIKKQTVVLIVGAVLVFGATFIINLVTKATSEVLS